MKYPMKYPAKQYLKSSIRSSLKSTNSGRNVLFFSRTFNLLAAVLFMGTVIGCERPTEPINNNAVSESVMSDQSGGGGNTLPSEQSQGDRLRRDHVTGGQQDHSHTSGDHGLGEHQTGDHGVTGEHQIGNHGVTSTDEKAASDEGIFHNSEESTASTPKPER